MVTCGKIEVKGSIFVKRGAKGHFSRVGTVKNKTLPGRHFWPFLGALGA